MDAISTLSGLQQAQTAQQVQTAVAKKVLDTQRAQGEAALQLLQSALPTSGPATAGVGEAVDVYA